MLVFVCVCVGVGTHLAVCLSKLPLRKASHSRWSQVRVMLHVVHKCTEAAPNLPMCMCWHAEVHVSVPVCTCAHVQMHAEPQ
jgi:hypothetical protein